MKFQHGKVIKHKRKKDGLTQPEVAEAAGISRFKLGRIENGDNFSLEEFAQIGKALHMPMIFDWLREEEELNGA